jgi:hypothetical protein
VQAELSVTNESENDTGIPSHPGSTPSKHQGVSRSGFVPFITIMPPPAIIRPLLLLLLLLPILLLSIPAAVDAFSTTTPTRTTRQLHRRHHSGPGAARLFDRPCDDADNDDDHVTTMMMMRTVSSRRPLHRTTTTTRTRRRNSYRSSRTTSRRRSSLVVLQAEQQAPPFYGRGDEIWPPTNENTVIRLADSLVDTNANAALRRTTKDDDLTTTTTSLLLLGYRRPLVLIVTLVSTLYQLLLATTTSTATFLLPLDLLVLIGLSGYIYLIHRLDVLPTPTPEDRTALSLYDQPLGVIDAARYEVWDTIGIYIGIILPFLLCLSITSSSSSAGSENGIQIMMLLLAMVGRPVVLYCAQRLTEHVVVTTGMGGGPFGSNRSSSRPSVSLPLRALIPILYTAVRLLYYGYYCFCCNNIGGGALLDSSTTMMIMTNTATLAIVLTVANLVYATVQLFLVLPWVALRHLRVHCFLVEAENVQLRNEAGLGLTPTNGGNASSSSKRR